MKFRKTRQIHLVGIGGSGMCGIAEVLLTLGYHVTGSDLASSNAVRRLRRLGAKIRIGHKPTQVEGADVVVTSSAIAAENPEVREARRLAIPIIPRAEMLAELMRMKYGIAVAGSHGKTSTTSMIAAVLGGCGLDPTIVVGGRIGSMRANARLGHGELMVAEADESDGSFLRLKPTIAVVTNIDREHLDHYRDLEEIQDAFIAFLNRVPFYGTAFLCLDDPGVQKILPRLERRHVSYGFSSQAEFTATDGRLDGFSCSYTARRGGRPLGEITLRVPGRHSMLNSLAAVAVGLELDLPFAKIAKALSGFRGVDRRFQKRGEKNGVLVVDDYGHHPTEIIATLSAAREAFGRRLVVVFQPHRFTRTRALASEFHRAFYQAGTVIVTEIYPAGETPLPGITGEALSRGIAGHGHRDVRYERDMEKIPALLDAITSPGDVVITLGAGSVWKVGEAFLRTGGGARLADASPRPIAADPEGEATSGDPGASVSPGTSLSKRRRSRTKSGGGARP